MTDMLRFKNFKCIEWIVDSWYSGSHSSESFFIQDHKSNLKLMVHESTYPSETSTCLDLEIEGHLKSPITVTVQVKNINYTWPVRTKASFTGEYQTIWSNTQDLSGEKLTIEVIIHMEFPKEDRCTQTASYLNPQLSTESLTKDFSNILNSGLNNDAELKCGEDSLKFHKIIISARSEVLKDILENKVHEGVITFQDMDSSHFQEFARYLYTGVLPELTLEKAKAFYQSGYKYDIQSLVVRCTEYMEDNRSKENAFEIFEFADAHSDQNLKDSIITFVLNEKLYQDETYWLPFYENYPKLALEVYRSAFKKRRLV